MAGSGADDHMQPDGPARPSVAASPSGGGGVLPRLLKRSEFLAAAAGRRFHTERMSVQLYARGSIAEGPDKKLSGPRFGLTVTKKTANAVGRNRIRRRLREVLRGLRPQWPESDIDIVIIGRQGLLNAPMHDIASDLERAFLLPPRKGRSDGSSSERSGPRRGKSLPARSGHTQHHSAGPDDSAPRTGQPSGKA